MKDNRISITPVCVISDAAEVWLWDVLIISPVHAWEPEFLVMDKVSTDITVDISESESELERSVWTHEVPRPLSIHSHTCVHIFLSTNIYCLETMTGCNKYPECPDHGHEMPFPWKPGLLEKDSKCGTRTHKISLQHFDTPGCKDAVKGY